MIKLYIYNMAKRKMVKVSINQEAKPCYKSKTLWFNVLTVVGGLCTAIAGDIKSGATLTLIGIISTGLRIYTNTAIKR